MKNSFLGLLIFVSICSCQFFETEKISTESFYEEELKTIDWNDIDRYPALAQCDTASEKVEQKSCFESSLSQHIYDYISTKKIIAYREVNDTLLLEFLVTNQGRLSVSSIQIDSSTQHQFPQLEKWILESMDSISILAPAYKRGIPVKTEFTIPIIIRTQDL